MNTEIKTERISFEEVLEIIQEQMDSCSINLICPIKAAENRAYSNAEVETTSIIEPGRENNLQTAELVLTNKGSSASMGSCLTSLSKNLNVKNKKLNRCKECYELALRIQSVD